MSKRKSSPAAISASAMPRVTSSLYAPWSISLLGEMKPPCAAQISAASVEDRNVISACAPLPSFSATATSPPLTTGDSSPTAGNGNTLASVPTSASVSALMFAVTKSPSKTIAAGVSPENVWVTDFGNSVWSAPERPPAISSSLPHSSASVVRASLTEGSVHLISCLASWSYFSGPACER
jgi:hypothetical protein